MRNMVIVTLRRLGFPGWRIAEVFGLTPTYVARLKSAAARVARRRWPGRTARAARGRWGRISRTWRGSGVRRGNRIWRSAGGWVWRGPRWPAAWPRGRRRGRMRCRGRRSLSSRNRAGTRNWLRNPGRSLGRRQIQGRSRKRNRSPEAGPGWQLSRGREGCGRGAGRGRWRSAAAGAGRAEDHRRGVLVAVCGGDAAARVHGPGRGGAGAGVRRRGARPVRAVRRCGAAVGHQPVLRAGG